MAGPHSTQLPHVVHVHSLQTLSPAHVVYPTKDSLQGLQNAKNLVARATTLQSYRSRLVQPQVRDVTDRWGLVLCRGTAL
jgi:hypothetical protein